MPVAFEPAGEVCEEFALGLPPDVELPVDGEVPLLLLDDGLPVPLTVVGEPEVVVFPVAGVDVLLLTSPAVVFVTAVPFAFAGLPVVDALLLAFEGVFGVVVLFPAAVVPFDAWLEGEVLFEPGVDVVPLPVLDAVLLALDEVVVSFADGDDDWLAVVLLPVDCGDAPEGELPFVAAGDWLLVFVLPEAF